MMPHARGARRKQSQRRATFPLDAKLIAFDTGAKFVITDLHRSRRWRRDLVLHRGRLFLTEFHQRLWLGGVMAMAVNDHGFPPRKIFTPPCLRQFWKVYRRTS